MMWGSAWKTDRVNAQPHLRASRRVRTLGDVELLARRMVEEHWMAISRVAKVLAAAGELSGIESEAHWREEGILRRTPCSPAEVS